jgi:aspartate-semialdehyde dehydrogenase
VVGASTLIGTAVIEELAARPLPYAALTALDESRSLGTPIEVGEEPLAMHDVAGFDFSSVDLVFFCGRSALAERYAAQAAEHAWVIDGSSSTRGREGVPLVAADVNPSALSRVARRGLVALPGSASVALATALAPLAKLTKLIRVDVMTCHAVSGSGRGAVDELAAETVALLSGREARGRAFGRQIAFNVIPQVDALEQEGASREEVRLWRETASLLGTADLPVNVTAIRVPVFFGHSLSVHVAFDRVVSVEEARLALQRGKGLKVSEADEPDEYPTPAALVGRPDQVYVGRIRRDLTRDTGLNFWVVADNVRKCAAHNAVSVAQILVNRTL